MELGALQQMGSTEPLPQSSGGQGGNIAIQIQQIIQQYGVEISDEELQQLLLELQDVIAEPGGPELLQAVLAQELGQSPGGERSQPLTLYTGGYVDGYAEGGLSDQAEMVRQGGQGEDTVLLHLTPEEFEHLQSQWGEAEINPITGLPEYGFFSKVFKKVKNVVKKIVKNPIFQMVAPIALNFLVPGLGIAIGGMLGATGTAAAMVGNAVIGGGIGALSGQGARGILTGAAAGAGAAGAGGALGNAAGLSGRTASIAGNAALMGTANRVGGGKFKEGAIRGGLSAALQPAIETGIGKVQTGASKFKTGASKFLKGSPPTTPTTYPGGAGQVVTGPPIPFELDPNAVGPPPPSTGGALSTPTSGLPPTVSGSPPATVASQTPSLTPPPPPGRLDGLIDKYGVPVALAMAASSGSGAGATGLPPPLPNEFLTDLPQLEFDRGSPQGLSSGEDYFTYGRTGSSLPPQQEQGFFSSNAIPITASSPEGLTPEEELARQLALNGGTADGLARGGLSRGRGYAMGGLESDSAYLTYGQGPDAFEHSFFSNNQVPDLEEDSQVGPIRGTDQDQNFRPDRPEGGFSPGGFFVPSPPTVPWDPEGDHANGGAISEYRGPGEVDGPGSGRSDEIPAQLSDGEYVMDAETVALLGDGSTDAGAARLDEMRANLRKHKAKNFAKGQFSQDAKRPEEYLRKSKAEGGKIARATKRLDLLARRFEAALESEDFTTAERVGNQMERAEEGSVERILERLNSSREENDLPLRRARGGSLSGRTDQMMIDLMQGEYS